MRRVGLVRVRSCAALVRVRFSCVCGSCACAALVGLVRVRLLCVCGARARALRGHVRGAVRGHVRVRCGAMCAHCGGICACAAGHVRGPYKQCAGHGQRGHCVFRWQHGPMRTVHYGRGSRPGARAHCALWGYAQAHYAMRRHTMLCAGTLGYMRMYACACALCTGYRVWQAMGMAMAMHGYIFI